MDRAAVKNWVDGYERAWRTPGTGTLGEIFTEDALYRTSPYEDPARGLDQIAQLWVREREGPDEQFDMASEVIAVEGHRAVVYVEVYYGKTGNDWRDLWVLTFAADGRCSQFEEWPFAPRGQA
jgi:hypothetical protein